MASIIYSELRERPGTDDIITVFQLLWTCFMKRQE